MFSRVFTLDPQRYLWCATIQGHHRGWGDGNMRTPRTHNASLTKGLVMRNPPGDGWGIKQLTRQTLIVLTLLVGWLIPAVPATITMGQEAERPLLVPSPTV